MAYVNPTAVPTMSSKTKVPRFRGPRDAEPGGSAFSRFAEERLLVRRLRFRRDMSRHQLSLNQLRKAIQKSRRWVRHITTQRTAKLAYHSANQPVGNGTHGSISNQNLRLLHHPADRHVEMLFDQH